MCNLSGYNIVPTLEWNKYIWDGEYDWLNYNEEWSKPWGSSESQWFSAIYPRIHSFIPCNSILEIAPGFGRWTNFMLKNCKIYHGIDLSSKCINECRSKFKYDDQSCNFYLNNGTNLKDVYNIYSDFIFSYDSLVHVDPYVIEEYISQILSHNILNKNGVVFFHHSNLKHAIENNYITNINNIHDRDVNTDYKIVSSLINKYNGYTLIQELVNLGNCPLIDCYTIFCKADSVFIQNKYQIIVNSYSSFETFLSRALYNKYIF